MASLDEEPYQEVDQVFCSYFRCKEQTFKLLAENYIYSLQIFQFLKGKRNVEASVCQTFKDEMVSDRNLFIQVCSVNFVVGNVAYCRN